MSFLIDNYYFKELDNDILFTNIENDIYKYIDLHLTYIYINLQDKENTVSFNFNLETIKNQDGHYQTSGNISMDEYVKSNEQSYIDSKNLFINKIYNLYYHISDNLSQISHLIDKPLNIDLSCWSDDFKNKFNNVTIDKPDTLYSLLKKLKTDCFLNLISEYGENIKIIYEEPSSIVKIHPPFLEDNMKKDFSFYIINKFLTNGYSEEREISLDYIKSVNKTDIFEHKLKAAKSFYQKKSIITEIEKKTFLNNEIVEKKKRI